MRSGYVTHTWKYVAITLGIAWLVLFFGAIALWMHCDRTCPPTPDAAAGRIYPLNTHGSVVYLDHVERLRLYGLIAVALAIGIAAIGIEVLKGPLRFRR